MAAPESALYLVLVLGAAFISSIAGIMGLQSEAMLMADMPPNEINAVLSVVDDNRITAFSICGALGGALLSVAVFPIKGGLRANAIKTFVGVLTGFMFAPVFVFAPMVMEALPWAAHAERAMIVSALISLFSWGTLQELVPLAGVVAKSVIRWIFRLPDNHPVFGREDKQP